MTQQSTIRPTDLKYRQHGQSPFDVVVLHGGPGAPGEVEPVARELSRLTGVLEPFQTSYSVDGQVEELAFTLKTLADPPVTLIGFSWGAMLGVLTTARHPDLIKKLIIVSSGVYTSETSRNILKTRLDRLDPDERTETEHLLARLRNPDEKDQDTVMGRIGHLLMKADNYDPLPEVKGNVQCQFDLHHSVWSQAKKMRDAGEFVHLAGQIRCPVLALHGEYDPHPVEGVRDALAGVIKDFRFISLERCGHVPWIERHARDRFFQILEHEIQND